jgi:hypothetical protein
MVSEHYEYNTSCTDLFLKIAVRVSLNAHISTIVVLTGEKLTEIYILPLFYAIYFM